MLILIQAVLFVSALQSATSPSAGAPPTLGFDSCPLSPSDVTQVAQLLSEENTQVWFLRPQSMVSPGIPEPPDWMIEAYLVPRITTERLRRGRIQRFYRQSASLDESVQRWKRSSADSEYSQVSKPGVPFPDQADLPDDSDMPFNTDPQIPDDDLVSILDVVRAPRSAAVYLKGGCVFNLNRVDGKWQLISVHEYVV